MLIFADSFDHYGTTPNGGRNAMLSGAWAEFSNGNNNPAAVSNAITARTGTYSLRFQHNNLATAGILARRVFGASLLTVGLGMGFRIDTLPSSNNIVGIRLKSGTNTPRISLIVQSDGTIEVILGASTSLGSTDSAITTGSWHHIECKAVIDDTVGSVEVRVNGETEFVINNINTGTIAITQFDVGTIDDGGGSFNIYIDDLFAWNDAGSHNNDFMGPQRVLTIFPNGDVSPSDWAIVGTSNGYDAINNVPPDGDGTYIGSDNVGEIAEFTLASLPPETEAIAAVYIPLMGKLEEAGIGNVQVSLVSNGEVISGPDQGLTTAYTYWNNVLETDPDTDAPWTKEGLEAALLRIEKTL